MKRMRRLIWLLLTPFVLIVLGYGTLLWQHNRAQPEPDRKLYRVAWLRTLDWLEANRAAVLSQKNPALWWMLHESHAILPEPRLAALIADFDADRVFGYSIWGGFFDPSLRRLSSVSSLNDLESYLRFFAYAFSCDYLLGTEDDIRQQLKADYCPPIRHWLTPCVTHQLMAVRFLIRHRCGDQTRLANLSSALLDTIERELHLDPRLGDLYIQRLLMLAVSGRADRIRPVWRQRLLSVQRPDGGYGDFQPLIPLPGGHSLGLHNYVSGTGVAVSNFHATAQAVWLLSLLQQPTSP